MTQQTSLFPFETESQIASRRIADIVARDPGRAEMLQKAARHFCHSNQGLVRHGVAHSVTADDVAKECGIIRIRRTVSHYTHRSNNDMGGVFRGKEWRRLGFVKSIRAGRQSSAIRMWTLQEYYDIAKPQFDRVFQ